MSMNAFLVMVFNQLVLFSISAKPILFVFSSVTVTNVQTGCPEKTLLRQTLTPNTKINKIPKKSFKEYIDFPIHDLSNEQFFASDNNNNNSTDMSTDADNLSFIELCSDSELFDAIEIDYCY